MATQGELVNGPNIETHDSFRPLKFPVQVEFISLTEAVTESTAHMETVNKTAANVKTMTEKAAHMERMTETAANMKTSGATVNAEVNLAVHAKMTITSNNRQSVLNDNNTVSSAPVQTSCSSAPV